MPRPRKIHVLEQEQFELLLGWLDEDRERAALRYEEIRWRLITIFAARGCPVAEELADETIDRVARRVAEIAENYSGEKARYFFGVANNVHHEYLKRPLPPEPGELATSHDPDRKEQVHHCLEQCLGKFPPADREMILRYYSEAKSAKADLHRQMADEMTITINSLRLRILRMKEKLQSCVKRCVERSDIH